MLQRMDQFGAGVIIHVSSRNFLFLVILKCLMVFLTMHLESMNILPVSYGNIHLELSVLDFYMDGQIGSHGENSLVPCMVEGLLGLGSPNSAKDDSSRKTTPLKVLDKRHCFQFGLLCALSMNLDSMTLYSRFLLSKPEV